MASWHELKQESRKAVHAAFGRSASYVLGVNAPVTVDVRLHENVEQFGDLDREGYARTIETINKMIFMRDQITPQKGAVVTLADDSSQYRIHSVWPMEGPLEQVCEVVKL